MEPCIILITHVDLRWRHYIHTECLSSGVKVKVSREDSISIFYCTCNNTIIGNSLAIIFSKNLFWIVLSNVMVKFVIVVKDESICFSCLMLQVFVFRCLVLVNLLTSSGHQYNFHLANYILQASIYEVGICNPLLLSHKLTVQSLSGRGSRVGTLDETS